MTAFIQSLVAFLVEQGPSLLIAATVLLTLGSGVMLLHRSPGHRQRIGEATIAAVLGFLLLAILPLPRTELGNWLRPSDVTAQAEPSPRPQQELSTPPLTVDAPNLPERSSGESNPLVPAFDEINTRPVSEDAALTQVDPAMIGPQLPPRDVFLPNDTRGALNDHAALGSPVEDRTAEERQAMEPAASNADLSTVTGPVPSDTSANNAGSAGALTTTDPHTILQHQALPPSEVLAWCVIGGSLTCCLWLLLGRIQLWRVTRSAQQASSAVYDRVRESLSGRQKDRVRVLISDRGSRPITFGLLRPTILIPAGLVRASSTAALAHVLRHECAHINRRDAMGQAVCNASLPLMWLHPLYWFLRYRTRLDAELVADDWAAGQSSAADYVEQLVHLVRRGRGSRMATVGVMGLFSSQSQFARRMEMLMQRSTRLSTCCSRTWKGMLMILVCGAALVAADAVGGRRAAAQQSDDQARAEMQERLAQLQDIVAHLEAQTQQAMVQAKEQAKRAEAAEAKAAKMAEQLDRVLTHMSETEAAAVHEKKSALVAKDQANQLAAATNHLEAQQSQMAAELAALRDENQQLKAAMSKRDLPTANNASDSNPFAGTTKNEVNAPVNNGPPNPAANNAKNNTVDPFVAGVASNPQPSANAADPFAANSNNPFAASMAGGTSSPGAGELDILSLATALADGRGEMRKAEIHLSQLTKARDTGGVSDADVQMAEIDLETQHRKVKLYQSLAEASLQMAGAHLEASQAQLERTAQLAEKNFVSKSELHMAELQVRQAEYRVHIIKQLLAN